MASSCAGRSERRAPYRSSCSRRRAIAPQAQRRRHRDRPGGGHGDEARPAAPPDQDRVQAPARAGVETESGLHPRGPPPAGLGLRLLRGLPTRRCPHPSPAGQDRGRPEGPEDRADRPGNRVQGGDPVTRERRPGAGLRLRITIAFVGAALAVSALVAGTTYALAERYLVRQRVDDALQQSLSNMRFAVQELVTTATDGGDLDEEVLEADLSALAASFNDMAAALEERIARERRFVGDVPHELRPPLTTLRASTDYLLEHGDELTPPVRRAAELLAADLEYLQRLVDDLLDLSRVEAGRVDMAWERLNVADLAREVVARRTRTGSQIVRIEVEAEPERLATVADKQRLERVVGNLLENALSHGEGKDVTVRVGAEDGSVRLAVEDRGPGIPPGAAHRIFERFYKADPSRRRREGRGSGLGLAIARENAHLHGGEIFVSNGRSGGTRFELRLPRRDIEPVEP